MSNPGPASTQTIHPSNLASNQAIRLIGVLVGANLNQGASTDLAIPVQNTSNFSVSNVIVTNASASLSSATIGLYPAANAQGTAIVAGATALSANTSASVVNQLTVASTAIQAEQNMYVRIGTAQAATADIYVYGYDFSNYNLTNPIGA